MKGKLKYVPRNNQVLIRQLEPEDRSPGGVIIPDMSRENIAMGRVVAMGPGKEIPLKDRDFEHEDYPDDPAPFRYEPIDGIAVGDIVFFNIKRTIPCSPDPKDAMGMVSADDVLATVEIEAGEQNGKVPHG